MTDTRTRLHRLIKKVQYKRQHPRKVNYREILDKHSPE